MKFVEYFLTEISLHHRRMKTIRVFPRKTSCIQMILLNPQRNVSEKYGSMKQCLMQCYIEIDMEKQIPNGENFKGYLQDLQLRDLY